MVNQNYRMIRKEQEARVERDRIKIAAAINNGQCVYKDERGYYRWKNPITEKDEPYNVNHIIEKYGLDFSWFAQTEKQKKQDSARKNMSRISWNERRKMPGVSMTNTDISFSSFGIRKLTAHIPVSHRKFSRKTLRG